MIRIKRVYDPPEREDGARLLVERLWPRGIKKTDLRMSACADTAAKKASPDAYETLLWDAMANDTTLFIRADQVEAAWKLLTPILDVWASAPPSDFPNYASGTWGPEAAEVLIAQDGRTWLQPTSAHLAQEPQASRVPFRLALRAISTDLPSTPRTRH